MSKRKSRSIFYGWWIVIASSVLNFFVGGTFFYGFTAFFNPIRSEFGWTSAQTALAFSLQRLEGGIAAPIVGFIFDRIGPKRLIFFGMLLTGSGLVIMSRIQSLSGFYVSFVLASIGTSLGLASVSMATIANWFIKKRAIALSFLLAGFGLSGLVVPVLVLLIDKLGWRMSLIYVGIAIALLGIPVAMIARHRPEQYGYLPDGETKATGNWSKNGKSSEVQIISNKAGIIEHNFTVKEAARTRSFYLIALTYMMTQLATSAIIILEMPYLESIGISREVAGITMTFMTLLSLVGRLSSGFLGDIIDKRYIVAAALCLQSLGMIIFANVQQPWHLIPFLLVYGPSYGGTIPIRPAIIADYFGRRNFGAIQGLMMGIAMLGGIASPVIGGWVFDVTGSYRSIFVIYAGLAAIGIPAILAASRPRLSKHNGE